MADEGYVLSESDVRQLQELISDYNRRYQGLSRDFVEPGDSYLPPEVYVVSVPSGGIPPSSGPLPGSTFCDVYRASQYVPGTGNLLGPWTLEAVYNVRKEVFNLSESVVPGGQWALAFRDKYGIWYVQPPAESPGFFAEITDYESLGSFESYPGDPASVVYSWQKMVPGSRGSFVPDPDGVTGTFSAHPGYEKANNPAVPIGSIVWMREGYSGIGTGSLEYVFACPSRSQMIRLATDVPNASGYYDAYIQRYDFTTDRWMDVERIWFMEANFDSGCACPGDVDFGTWP